MKSVFLANLHHAYAQTDGTYAFPNSREGDMLKRAKLEIKHHVAGEESLRQAIQEAEAAHWRDGNNASQVRLETLRYAFALVTETAVGGAEFNLRLRGCFTGE